jgi:rhamnose utilization protein RhaD (predicted bifunctional aldolase and dehydrogenase)/NAD(P)-dependent dehydrogenase (short-subunit alcohol dehydrogenase family)
MQNFWSDGEASVFPGELGQRVYTSRLLGRDKTLVLHGGGNTSVKIRERTVAGDELDVLYVKGSGADLEHITIDGFSPVRLAALRRLATLEKLTDTEMLNEMRTNLTRASAPAPSVEAILHAIIPHKYVDHTHADAVLAVTNSINGSSAIAEIYGDSAIVVPYAMPGFALSRVCAELLEGRSTDGLLGLVLMNHGIVSFGHTARESYDRMIRLAAMAEDYLNRMGAPASLHSFASAVAPAAERSVREIALLRRDISAAAGKPMVLRVETHARALHFIRRPDLSAISQQGPPTPDHIIRTKRVPMLGRDVTRYVEAYNCYFAEQSRRAREPLTSLDPAPRVVLDAEIGMCAAGSSATAAAIAADLYQHAMDIIERAEILGGYRALPEEDLFDVEYWELEQAKLKRASAPPAFTGEVALVTGGASGIGKACVDSLLERGAAVAALDIAPSIEQSHDRAEFLGITCDVTAHASIRTALERTVQTFGGLDILILNAGIFPGTAEIAELADDTWRYVMQVNLDANLMLLRECYELLRLSPRGGRVVIIGSKNVRAPGKGVAAYSASKAALAQLGRVAALEWAGDGIRVNQVHPDAVFETGLWTDEILASRAGQHGLSVAEYRQRNLLRSEVTARDVAEVVAELCGSVFAKTTGAQIPIDGGNERVI